MLKIKKIKPSTFVRKMVKWFEKSDLLQVDLSHISVTNKCYKCCQQL